MPQLDQVTFLSQFFWLCVFFFGFYFVISKDFLPKMARILKFRKKKMNLSSGGVQSMQQENEKVRASSKALVENGLSASNDLCLSHLQRIESWLSNVITSTNQKQLQGSNTLYVQSIGDNAIRQQIALQGATFTPTARIFASILAEKCKNRGQVGHLWTQTNNSPESRPESLDQRLAEKSKRTPQQITKARTPKK